MRFTACKGQRKSREITRKSPCLPESRRGAYESAEYGRDYVQGGKEESERA